MGLFAFNEMRRRNAEAAAKIAEDEKAKSIEEVKPTKKVKKSEDK
jgi:hypothetical protein